MVINNNIMDIFYRIQCRTATLADQEEALKDPVAAYYFAAKVPGADIEKCQEVACQDPECAYYFSNISGADIKKCVEVCKGTEYEARLNQYLMYKALN